MDVAGVDVIRGVGVSLQNNSGVIVYDKWKKKEYSKVLVMVYYIQDVQTIAFVWAVFDFKSLCYTIESSYLNCQYSYMETLSWICF